jgi:hypothetical protein
MDVMHARVQHGVGQGSFHSATVEGGGDDGRVRFDYVYDCGAMSGGGMSKALKRNVARLGLEQRAGSSGRGVLDVMVLSHYDYDHLNGAKLLSDRFDVERIFLPYLSLEELAFVIASQADVISAEQVTELHQLAHGGGTLWGVPVTMVRGGEGEGSELPPLPDAPSRSKNARGFVNGVPLAVRLKLRGAGIDALPASMSHKIDVLAEFASGRRLWKLRFWNRGLDSKLVAQIRDNLTACGFPLDKLEDPGGAVQVIKWLAIPRNRAAAVKAYGDAIKTRCPSWAHEAKCGGLANLLSLAMYAGPDVEVDSVRCMRRHRTVTRYWPDWWNEDFCADKVGWLGTGDAPLGEADVWTDFQDHFAHELPNVSTYLVPHHGAAPSGGPRYYNPGFNRTPGIASVISYGTTNNYGHPRFSVLAQVMAKHGNLYAVTEKDEDGLHEVFRFEST